MPPPRPTSDSSPDKAPTGEKTPLLSSTEALHALMELYRAILAAVPDIIMEVDAQKVYTWANDAGKAFFGDDVIGHPALDYFEGEQDTYAIVEPLFQGTEETVYVESWQRRCDGQKRLLAWWCRALKDKAGHVVGSLSTARDITEQRQATETIRQDEQRLRAVLSNMPILLDAFDENRRIIEWNDECERVTGYSAEEMIGRADAWELLYPDKDYREKMLAEWKRRGNEFRNWEWDLTCKDGHVRTIAWSHMCETFPVPGWASWGVGVDVTDRLENERKISRLNENLERRVRERTEELHRTVDLMAGREIRMAELKDVIHALREQLLEAGMEPKASDPLIDDETPPGTAGKTP